MEKPLSLAIKKGNGYLREFREEAVKTSISWVPGSAAARKPAL